MAATIVGPYEITSRLGAGGMGEVFLGHDPRLQRRVALKRLTKVDAQADELGARVLREARAAARLNHPNIAAVYDVLEHDGQTYIVMEYVEGMSLAIHMRRRRLPVDEVRAIGRQIASALIAAHAHGVIHRDLKPANIQVTADGSIKVLDFGVARISPLQVTSTGAPTDGVDATIGGNPGTTIYMSPEQLLEKEIDARSDIYSAGVILFEMATARRPYVETGSIALAMAMMGAAAPRARSLHPDIPPDLDETIARALERDPADRIQTAQELEHALAGIGDVAPAPGQTLRRGRGRWWLLAAAAAIVLGVGAAIWRPAGEALGLRRAAGRDRPSLLAILPVDNPTGDGPLQYFGAGLASVIADNFGSVPGLQVLSRASTAAFAGARADLTPLAQQLGADYVVDLAVREGSPHPRVAARLRRADASAPLWQQDIEGDALTVEKRLLDGIGRALVERGAFRRRLTAADWTRIGRMPTTSSEALVEYSRARALLDRPDVPENVDQAIERLEHAAAIDPRFAIARAALGDALWRKYQREKAPALAARATAVALDALRIEPDQAQTHHSLGVMFEQTGESERALESYRRAIHLQPDNDESHQRLGLLLSARGQFDAAVAELQEAIRIRPSFGNHYFALGFIEYAAGRFDAALEAYHRAADLQPRDAWVFAMLGATYHVLGQIDQAVGNYQHAVRLGPTRAAYANLGLAYYSARRYAEALAAYKTAAELEPAFALTHRSIGDVYVKLGQDRNAREAFARAIELGEQSLKVNARDASTISLIATCEAKLGRAAAAEGHAAEAVALAPASREARVRSAQVYARLNRPDAALQELAAAIARGYEPRQAREEEEFASLRTLPEFQKLTGASK